MSKLLSYNRYKLSRSRKVQVIILPFLGDPILSRHFFSIQEGMSGAHDEVHDLLICPAVFKVVLLTTATLLRSPESI